MKTICMLISIGFLLLPPIGMAKSAFDGTWRPDPQKFDQTRAPDVFELANGVYSCQSCTPAYKVKADGHDQPIVGNAYYDTISIVVVDAQTLKKTAKKSGQPVMESTISVSADGKTESERQTMYDMSPKPIEMTSHSTRLAAGSPGSHRISGAWRLNDADVSNHAEDTVFAVDHDALSMSDKMGRSFSAKLDGTDAPYKGSDEFSSVSVKMLNPTTIEESDKSADKVVKITRWSIDPDGKTIHARFDDTHGHVQNQTGHKVD